MTDEVQPLPTREPWPAARFLVPSLAVAAVGAGLLYRFPTAGYMILGAGGLAFLFIAAGGPGREPPTTLRLVGEFALLVGWSTYLATLAGTPAAFLDQAGRSGGFDPGPLLIAGWIVSPVVFTFGLRRRLHWRSPGAAGGIWAALMLGFAVAAGVGVILNR